MPLTNKTNELSEISDQQIFHWHLELSSKCALQCPRCPRTRWPDRYKVTEMTLDFVKKILPPERLSLVERMLINGGQGDSIYCNDFIKIIKYFKDIKNNIQLSIVTNGSYRKREWWKDVARILNKNDNITFSIDGWDQKSNEQYRVNSHFKSIMEGLKTLRQFNSQVYIVWSSIIFKFNQDKIDTIKNLAERMGVDAFNIVQSQLFGSVNKDFIDPKLGYDPLEPDETLVESSNTNRGFYIHFTERSSSTKIKTNILQFIDKYRETYNDSYIFPLCRIGERGLYVDAEGILYPCSWVSHPFVQRGSKKRDKSIHWEKSLWVEHKDDFNLNRHSLESILQNSLWKKLRNSWFDSKKAFVECERHCHQFDSNKKIKVLLSKTSYEPEESIIQNVKNYRKKLERA